MYLQWIYLLLLALQPNQISFPFLMFLVFERIVFQVLGPLNRVLLIITYYSHHFSSYINPCSRDKKEKIGQLMTHYSNHCRPRNIVVILALTLKFMLNVSKLPTNLLSIDQITKDLNYTYLNLFPIELCQGIWGLVPTWIQF